MSVGRAKHGPAFTLNPIRGVPGDYFRADRPAELRQVCLDILAERGDK